MFSPSRGGVRGGKDQFNWETVKGDKYREFYLGQTVKTKPVWWTSKIEETAKKTAPTPHDAKAEFAALKKQEEELLKEALGFAPAKTRGSGKILEKHELDELFKRGNTERDEFSTETRVEGLGYAPAPTHRDNLSSELTKNPLSASVSSTSSTFEQAGMVHVSSADDGAHGEGGGKKESKKDKKREKKEKKEKKRKHKEEKEKKHKKRRVRHDSEDEGTATKDGDEGRDPDNRDKGDRGRDTSDRGNRDRDDGGRGRDRGDRREDRDQERGRERDGNRDRRDRRDDRKGRD